MELRTSLITVIASLALMSCSKPPQTGLPVDTLVRISEDEPKSLDPQSASDLASTRIAAEQFEGLTRFSANGLPEAGLSQHWQESAGGLDWRFSLRPGLRFSDGTPITAQTFVAVFARLRASATASPHGALFEAITAMTADGPLSLRITLNAPTPHLPELLAHPAIAALPVHQKGWITQRPVVSSGAYRLTDWQLGNAIDLERNPAWHGGAAPTPKIRWRAVSDTLVALRQFQGGEADVVGEVPSSRLEDIRAQNPGALRIAPYNGSYYFAFNTRKPPFDDVRVRRALSLVVDRDWLATKLMGTGVTPAWGVIPEGISGLKGFKPEWANAEYEARREQAQQLLKAAGYGASNPLQFEIRFNSDTDHRRVAVALASMWRMVGVEAQLLNSEASLHFASLRRGDFALARSGWIGDVAAPENYLAVHTRSNGTGNYAGFADVRFETLLTAARKEADPARRALAMRAAEARLMEESPILPLWTYVSKSLVAERVEGWQDNPSNQHPSRTLSIR
jgi:oligopeptide transport system substrate-binding protein